MVTPILTFALVAPIASFGGIAIGERRSGWERPARSAVLGLVGACLGVERSDEVGQAALAEQYGLAMLCYASGSLLADYHTTQVPSAKRKRKWATRAEELAEPALNTILSRRDYRVGAWHIGALWSRAATPRWPLETIAHAMQQPAFAPYLGRKACPLGLPLAPLIVHDAPDVVAALRARHADGPEAAMRQDVLFPPARHGEITLVLDAVAPAGDPADVSLPDAQRRIERRRDQPLSRRRWQFDLREELVLGISLA